MMLVNHVVRFQVAAKTHQAVRRQAVLRQIEQMEAWDPETALQRIQALKQKRAVSKSEFRALQTQAQTHKLELQELGSSVQAAADRIAHHQNVTDGVIRSWRKSRMICVHDTNDNLP